MFPGYHHSQAGETVASGLPVHISFYERSNVKALEQTIEIALEFAIFSPHSTPFLGRLVGIIVLWVDVVAYPLVV